MSTSFRGRIGKLVRVVARLSLVAGFLISAKSSDTRLQIPNAVKRREGSFCMGVFKKKIKGTAARDLFAQWYKNILSDEEMALHRGQLRQIKEASPLLANVRQEVFDEELTTVNIQLLGIAWAKYSLKRRIPLTEGIDFMSEVEALVPGLMKYEESGELYNMAFGSSAEDGLTPMAELFVSNIMDDYIEVNGRHPDKIDEIVRGSSFLFKKSYDIYKNMIERSQIIG